MVDFRPLGRRSHGHDLLVKPVVFRILVVEVIGTGGFIRPIKQSQIVLTVRIVRTPGKAEELRTFLIDFLNEL